MAIIQPLTQGSSLISSGWSSSAPLIRVTLPLTGANRSLSVLTLSIVPKVLPAVTLSPTLMSRLTSVMSPSASTANAVMPTRSSLPSVWAHSWSLVYLRSSLTSFGLDIVDFVSSAAFRSLALVKWSLYDPCGDLLAAAIDEQLAADRARREGDIAETDALAQCRGGAARGALPECLPFAVAQRVAVAGDAAPGHFEADQNPFQTARFDRHQRRFTAEIRLVQLDHPAQTCLERVGRLVDFVAVQREPRVQPQRVARAQADGLDS